MSLVERSIILCPYLGGSAIKNNYAMHVVATIVLWFILTRHMQDIHSVFPECIAEPALSTYKCRWRLVIHGCVDGYSIGASFM